MTFNRLCLLTFTAAAAVTSQPASMARVETEPRVRVAILIFNGVQIIDFAAPYEVMGQAGYEVFTVAETTAAVTTAMGMQTTPRYGFTDHPRPDILLLPGGNVDSHLQNAALMSWVRSNAAAARYVLSVCNGAFFLSRAGLLDGLKATTFYGLIDELRAQTPDATIVADRRFVDNGRIVTAAGLSSGIDGALHVVAKVSGAARAQMVALNMEYRLEAGRHLRARQLRRSPHPRDLRPAPGSRASIRLSRVGRGDIGRSVVMDDPLGGHNDALHARPDDSDRALTAGAGRLEQAGRRFELREPVELRGWRPNVARTSVDVALGDSRRIRGRHSGRRHDEMTSCADACTSGLATSRNPTVLGVRLSSTVPLQTTAVTSCVDAPASGRREWCASAQAAVAGVFFHYASAR